jgi:D-sedoheptulose 7-phosphate isomerase
VSIPVRMNIRSFQVGIIETSIRGRYTVAISDYFQTLFDALNSISISQLDLATALLEHAYQSDQVIYVIGNGQSATTATAFALDFTKQTITPDLKHRFRVIALTDNMAAVTAWANDLNYESVFTEQLKSLFRPNDVLIAISASGNSPKVVAACQWVKQNKGHIVGLAGFDGGQLKDIADACLVIHVDDYGHIETAHLAILHYWVDLFRERLAS